MASEESPWKKIGRNRDEWTAKAKASDLANILCGDSLKDLEPDRGEDAFKLLKAYILYHCFRFEDGHNNEQTNLVAKFREGECSFVESGEKALQNIKDLLSFMEKFHPLHGGVSAEVNEDLNQEPSIDIDTILSKYHLHLSEYIRITKKKLMPAWVQHGILYFPGGLENQTQRKHPQVNGLLFAIVFLLRQYTNQNVSGECWLQRMEGSMPATGRPHYKLVAEILNAANDLCKPRIFPGKLSEHQVRKRIKTLVDSEVELSMSIMDKYYQIQEDINAFR